MVTVSSHPTDPSPLGTMTSSSQDHASQSSAKVSPHYSQNRTDKRVPGGLRHPANPFQLGSGEVERTAAVVATGRHPGTGHPRP